MKKGIRIRIGYLAIAAALFALTGFWACGDHDHGNPTVKILQPADSSSVAGPDILVRVQIIESEPGAAAKIAATAVHGEHVHVYLDKPATTDAAATAVLEPGVDTVTLKGVTPGSHYINVQGADENHRTIVGMRDSVMFTVTP